MCPTIPAGLILAHEPKNEIRANKVTYLTFSKVGNFKKNDNTSFISFVLTYKRREKNFK